MSNFDKISSFNMGGVDYLGEPLNIFMNACGTGRRNLCLNKCAVLHPNSASKRNACKANCPKADNECIEAKNNPQGAPVSAPVVADSPTSDNSATDAVEAKAGSDKTMGKYLLYGGIATVSVSGTVLLIWGIATLINKNKK